MGDAKLVGAIVVSFNTREMTLKCLQALKRDLEGTVSEIIVVDNASTDGSAAAIREVCPDVKVIENSANRGFGAANNQAMRAASGEYFLLVNSDAFLHPGATAAMLRCMGHYPEAGIVGPQLVYGDGSIQRSCFKFPSPARAWLENLWISAIVPNTWAWGDWRRWPHDQERKVDFVIGACLLARRKVFEETGGFDEDFFMYSEEADWEKRVTELGWTVRFTPAGRVTHLAGASGAADAVKINRHFWSSLDYYLLKHHGIGGLVLFRLANALGCALRCPIWALAWLMPGKREMAGKKLKLRLWLIGRQLTDWTAIRQYKSRRPAMASVRPSAALPRSPVGQERK